jgi:hypothetical protein
MLFRQGLPVRADLPHVCQSALGYRCPVYQQIFDLR